MTSNHQPEQQEQQVSAEDQHALSTGQPAAVDLEAIRRRFSPLVLNSALVIGPRDDHDALVAEVESLHQQLASAQAARDEWEQRAKNAEIAHRLHAQDNAHLQAQIAELRQRASDYEIAEGTAVAQRNAALNEALGYKAMRPAVRTFASVMEERLRANDHTGGWRGSLPSYLLRRLREEAVELEEAVSKWSREEVRHEAADVANFALMIADCFGGLAALDAASAGQPATPSNRPHPASSVNDSPTQAQPEVRNAGPSESRSWRHPEAPGE